MSEKTPTNYYITGMVVVIFAAVFIGAAFFVQKENIAGVAGALPPPPQIRYTSLLWNLATSSAAWETRDSFAAFIFSNKMWIIGGLNGNSIVKGRQINYWKAPHFNDIWSSEDGVVWNEERAHADFPPRRSMTVVYFKDKLWMFGGWSPVSGYQRDIWQSEDGVGWKKVSDRAAWPAREGQTVEIFRDRLWMMGGVNYDRHETKNDVWFSEDGLNWQRATSSAPWPGRWDHATAVFQDKIWLTGGMNIKNQVYRDVWNSSDGINWELVDENPPWEARQGHALLSYKNRLWILGRLNDGNLPTGHDRDYNDIWFSEDGRAWHKTDIDPPWTGREDFSALLFHDTIWVMGGMDASWQWRNDVWRAALP